jgi:hypothetical protein
VVVVVVVVVSSKQQGKSLNLKHCSATKCLKLQGVKREDK